MASAVEFALLDIQNLNLTYCITFSDIFHTNDPCFNKQKTLKILILKIFFTEKTQRITKYKPNITWKCEKWKWPLVSFNSIFSALTWPKIKSKDSFEKLTTSRFQNCPFFSKLTKIWWRYWRKTNWLIFGGSVWPQF